MNKSARFSGYRGFGSEFLSPQLHHVMDIRFPIHIRAAEGDRAASNNEGWNSTCSYKLQCNHPREAIALLFLRSDLAL